MTVPYNPQNNDSYTKVLSKNPVLDVLEHLLRSSELDERRGNDSAGVSAKKAAEKVLQFGKSSWLSLILIKRIKLKSPLPMSLIARYELENVTIQHTTPILFDPKNECFLQIMDRRFLRDVDHEAFTRGAPRALSSRFAIYVDGGGNRHMGLKYPSIESLRKDNENNSKADGLFAMFVDYYETYALSTKGGEKVIIIRYVDADDQPKFLAPRYNSNALPGVSSSGMQIEIAIGFKFGSRYYSSEDGVTFSASNLLEMDKQACQPTQEDSSSILGNGLNNYKHREAPGLLVLPYSDEQYKLLMGIQERLHSINRDLASILDTFVDQKADIDMAITPAALESVHRMISHKPV